jgi:class 3 adenylate cyclase
MPIYLDRHEPIPGEVVTPQAVAEAHMADMNIQGRFGVKYITYWFDQERQHVFCLVDSPNKELAETVHREAHGLLPSKIIEVDPGVVQKFLGSIEEPAPGEPVAESAFRTILFTDIEGSTSLTQRVGDDAAMTLLREHDAVVRTAIGESSGSLVKHTGDGMMASFGSATNGVRCAGEIQRRMLVVNEAADHTPVHVRVGLAAGEPVSENDDLFGAAVQLAARVCSECAPESVLASSTVRDLSIGKGFEWHSKGEVALKGFDEPVRVYELHWRDHP